MQGGTVKWPGVIGQPHDFSRNWAYTALSRARDPVELYLIDQPRQIEQEREDIAPSRRARSDDSLERMARRMRERDDEDLALEQLELPQPGGDAKPEAADRAVARAGERPDPSRFISPARQRYYHLDRQLDALQDQHAALPIRGAQWVTDIGKTIAVNEQHQHEDRRPRGLRDIPAHRWRKQERQLRLKRLRDQRAKLLESVQDPEAVLERAQQLQDHQADLARRRPRLREQAITEELDSQPPWLEQTLGPEPADRHQRERERERWQRTAREVAGHRIDRHITEPHIAIHQHDHNLGLTQTIRETRLALGLEAPGHERDGAGYEM